MKFRASSGDTRRQRRGGQFLRSYFWGKAARKGNLLSIGARLDEAATVALDIGQIEIERDGLRQSVAVTVRLSGSDLLTAINKIKAALTRDVKSLAGI